MKPPRTKEISTMTACLPKLKPWPRDVVTLVAPAHGTENRDQIVMPVAVECRDCGCDLVADQHTLTTAESMPERRGRPIEFLCVPCHGEYDLAHFSRPRSKGVDRGVSREWVAMQTDLGGEG